MRTILCVVGVLTLLVLLCPIAIANKTVLNAAEVTAFFSDRTMSIKEIIPDKKTGETGELKAFFSNLGGVRAIYEDGSSDSYTWSVTKDGAFCAMKNRRWRDGVCGFVVKDNDTYSLYVNKRGNQKAKAVEGRAVFDNRWKHFLTFSDIHEGEQL